MYNKFLNHEVVVDVNANIVYLGTLNSFNDQYLELINTDVHDINDSHSSKEGYIRNATITGIRANRKNCLIPLNKIISISLFKDIFKE